LEQSLAQGQLGMLALGLNRRQLAAFFDHSAGNLGDFDVHLLREVAHPSTSVSRVAELGQQWFGGLGQETVLSLVTDLHHWVLLLWGRRPADPSRICSQAGPRHTRAAAPTTQRLLTTTAASRAGPHMPRQRPPKVRCPRPGRRGAANLVRWR
jgi:hypothetical protein